MKSCLKRRGRRSASRAGLSSHEEQGCASYSPNPRGNIDTILREQVAFMKKHALPVSQQKEGTFMLQPSDMSINKQLFQQILSWLPGGKASRSPYDTQGNLIRLRLPIVSLSSQAAYLFHLRCPKNPISQYDWQTGSYYRSSSEQQTSTSSATPDLHRKSSREKRSSPSSGALPLFPPQTLEGPVTGIVWSPNGRYMACILDDCQTGRNIENTVEIRDSHTGVQLSSCRIPTCSRLLWSPDSTRFVIEWGPALVEVWDALTGERLGSNNEHNDSIHTIVQDLAWSPDSSRLACMGKSLEHGTAHGESMGRGISRKQIWVWNATTGLTITGYQGYSQREKTFHSAHGQVWPEALAWSPWGNHIASVASGDENLRIWDAITGEDVASTPLPVSSPIRGTLAWSPDGEWLAAALDQKICVWETTTTAPVLGKVKTYTGHSQKVLSHAWAPACSSINCRAIASVDESRCIHVWNVATGQTLATYQGHSQEQTEPGMSFSVEMAWSPDGQYVASALKEHPDQSQQIRRIHLWEATSGRLVAIMAGNFWGWTPHGLSIANVSDKTVIVTAQTLPLRSPF